MCQQLLLIVGSDRRTELCEADAMFSAVRGQREGGGECVCGPISSRSPRACVCVLVCVSVRALVVESLVRRG